MQFVISFTLLVTLLSATPFQTENGISPELSTSENDSRSPIYTSTNFGNRWDKMNRKLPSDTKYHILEILIETG